MKRRLTAFLLCAAIMLTLTPMAVFAESDVIEISTAEQLAAIGNDEAYPLSGNYVLTDNIDLSRYEIWTPIGMSYNDRGTVVSTPFEGTFNGNGYKISGLKVVLNTNRAAAGLFASTSNATIKNVRLDGASENDGSSSTGILVGIATNSEILNCYVSGTANGNMSVGGIVGGYSSSKCIIRNSCFIGTVSGIQRGAGGIISTQNGGTIIENCYASVTFADKQDGADYGIITATLGNSGTINNVYGDITKEQETQICPINESIVTNAVGKTTAEMQSQDFVDTLNNNITDDTWSSWTYQEGNYPIQSVFIKNPSPEGSASVEITGAAAFGDVLGIKSRVTAEGTPNITEFGTTFIPFALFEAEGAEVVDVKYTQSIENGQTYSALLTGIPAEYLNIGIVVMSYVKNGDNYAYSAAQTVYAGGNEEQEAQ